MYMFIYWFIWIYIYIIWYILYLVYMCFFFLHRLVILQLVDLPWFPWLSIPGSTMEVRIIMPFARRQRNANTNYWATGVACCQWGKNLVTIWYVKKWQWLHRYLLDFCYLSWWISGFCWDLFGQIWGTLKAKDILLRDALSQAFHCPLVRFLGSSSQNLLFYNIQCTFCRTWTCGTPCSLYKEGIRWSKVIHTMLNFASMS